MKIIINGNVENMGSIKGDGDGDGDGVLIYSRTNEFPSKEEFHFNIKANMKTDEMSMNISLISTSSHLYTINAK
jgi:hypothetical protein